MASIIFPPSRPPIAAQQLRDRHCCSSCCKHEKSKPLPRSRREGERKQQPPAALPGEQPLDAASVSASWLEAATTTTTPTTTTSTGVPYVPSPYTPGPEIWLGALLPTLVFALGSYEFGKRILIQRRCAVCAGTGLVDVPFNSSQQEQQEQQFRKVKCRACGGFFPWESASKFFSAAARPGNGGPLRPPALPRQTSVFYKGPSVEEAKRVAEELRAGRDKGGGDAE